MNLYDSYISGTLTVSGAIVPSANLAFDLGTTSNNFRHLYVGSGSIYMGGNKILGLNSDGSILLGTQTIQTSASLAAGSTTNAFTGSVIVSGSLNVSSNLIVTGSITAQQYIISSSVTYLTESFASGSHKFCDTIDDTHQFTGSVYMTGSLNVNNGTIFTTASSVSIGSTNPTEKLDVVGSIRFRTALQSDSYYATLAQNGYYTGGWNKYASGYARIIELGSGISFKISNAGAGNAGDAITFITPLNITDAGNTIVSGSLLMTGSILPGATGTYDLGSATARWGTVYTSDLSLNNGIGDWTIVEGEDDLFLYNNKKGKVYKFALTEVDPSVATPKMS